MRVELHSGPLADRRHVRKRDLSAGFEWPLVQRFNVEAQAGDLLADGVYASVAYADHACHGGAAVLHQLSVLGRAWIEEPSENELEDPAQDQSAAQD